MINVKKCSGRVPVEVRFIAPQPKPVEVKFIPPSWWGNHIVAWCPENGRTDGRYVDMPGSITTAYSIPITFKPRKHAKLRAAWSA